MYEDILWRDTCTPLFGHQTTETIVPQGIRIYSMNLSLGEEKGQEHDDSQRRDLSPRETFPTVLTTCLTTLQERLELRQWWLDELREHTLTIMHDT